MSWIGDIESGKAKAISEALKYNNTITSINLSANNIGEEKAAIAISEALRHNNTITSIDLSSNSIGKEEKAAIAISEA